DAVGGNETGCADWPELVRTCGGLAFGRRPFPLASASEQKDRDCDGQREEEKEEREARQGSEGAERIRVDGDGPRLRLLVAGDIGRPNGEDRKSTRLNSSHYLISYAVFC